MRKFGFKKIIGIVAMVMIFVFGLSAIVMFLWNFALAPSLNLNPLSYWQSMAILLLSKILFTGIRPRNAGGPWKSRWRSKYQNMSEDERHIFRDKWKKRCELEEK